MHLENSRYESNQDIPLYIIHYTWKKQAKHFYFRVQIKVPVLSAVNNRKLLPVFAG
jgi:hypothetical protein